MEKRYTTKPQKMSVERAPDRRKIDQGNRANVSNRAKESLKKTMWSFLVIILAQINP